MISTSARASTYSQIVINLCSVGRLPFHSIFQVYSAFLYKTSITCVLAGFVYFSLFTNRRVNKLKTRGTRFLKHELTDFNIHCLCHALYENSLFDKR